MIEPGQHSQGDTMPLHHADERPADVTRRGGRVRVDLWRIPAGACVTMPHQSVHGGDCPDQQRARASIAQLPTPSDATEARILQQRREWALRYQPPGAIHFLVSRLKDRRTVWASAIEGNDIGAAVSLALRMAGDADYFVATALAKRDAAGTPVEELDLQWAERRCSSCGRRCLVPTAQTRCPSCEEAR